MARRRRIPADVASADIALYQCAPMLEGPISGRTQQEAIALHLDDEAGPSQPLSSHCEVGARHRLPASPTLPQSVRERQPPTRDRARSIPTPGSRASRRHADLGHAGRLVMSH